MGVSHTASKRVLQVQTAVNPESCCLWFAFSPQHFALQTQQLCRRVFETAGTPLSGQHYAEVQWRSPSVKVCRSPGYSQQPTSSLQFSLCGRCKGAGTSSPHSRLSTSCSQSPAGKEQSWLCDIASDCVRGLLYCWHFMPKRESMYARKGLYAMVHLVPLQSCAELFKDLVCCVKDI